MLVRYLSILVVLVLAIGTFGQESKSADGKTPPDQPAAPTDAESASAMVDANTLYRLSLEMIRAGDQTSAKKSLNLALRRLRSVKPTEGYTGIFETLTDLILSAIKNDLDHASEQPCSEQLLKADVLGGVKIGDPKESIDWVWLSDVAGTEIAYRNAFPASERFEGVRDVELKANRSKITRMYIQFENRPDLPAMTAMTESLAKSWGVPEKWLVFSKTAVLQCKDRWISIESGRYESVWIYSPFTRSSRRKLGLQLTIEDRNMNR